MGEKFVGVAFTVDWLSMTFDSEWGWEFLRDMTLMYGLTEMDSHGQKGYNSGIEYGNGLRAAWHSEKPEQGLHVVMSGAVLRWYQSTGRDWHDIMIFAKECKGRASRVDLAVDIFDSGLNLTDLCKPNVRAYKGKGRTPSFTTVTSGDDGWTLYVGSRSSDKFLRIYNKAAEQKLSDTDYVRVELECKGEIAHAVGWEFPEMERDSCAAMARTLIRGQVDFHLLNWDAAMSSVEVNLGISQGEARDTMGWLVKSVAPALAKEIARRPREGVLEEFMYALRAQLQQRGLDLQ